MQVRARAPSFLVFKSDTMPKETTNPAGNQKPVTPLAFDIPKFCEAHDIGRSTVYEEIRAGRLQIMKVGKLTRISIEAATKWRRQREENATLDPAPARKSERPEAEAGAA